MDPTTSGHSSTLGPSRFNRLVTHRPNGGWELRHPVAGRTVRKHQGLPLVRGHPIMGVEVVLCRVDPSQESWQAVDLEGTGTAQELWESRVVGPKV